MIESDEVVDKNMGVVFFYVDHRCRKMFVPIVGMIHFTEKNSQSL